MALPRDATGLSAVCDCVFFPDNTHLLFSIRFYLTKETVTFKLRKKHRHKRKHKKILDGSRLL